MENNQENEQNQMEKDEIINPEQFQVSRAPEGDKEQGDQQEEMINRTDDSGYTPQENQFADGNGTQLDQEVGSNENDDKEEMRSDEDDFEGSENE